MAQKCPSCGLISPDKAGRCDCGHVFDQQALRRAGRSVHGPLHDRPERAPRVDRTSLTWKVLAPVLFLVAWVLYRMLRRGVFW